MTRALRHFLSAECAKAALHILVRIDTAYVRERLLRADESRECSLVATHKHFEKMLSDELGGALRPHAARQNAESRVVAKHHLHILLRDKLPRLFGKRESFAKLHTKVRKLLPVHTRHRVGVAPRLHEPIAQLSSPLRRKHVRKERRAALVAENLFHARAKDDALRRIRMEHCCDAKRPSPAPHL